MRPRFRSRPARDEAATVRAGAFVRARSRACTPLRPSQTRPVIGGSRRRGRTPHRRRAWTRATHTHPRVLCRILPFPAQLHDLGAIEQALSAVAHQAGLTCAPFFERHRPLVRTSQIERLLARLEDDAIDVAREDRRHIACDHRDHRFVEQRDSLRDVSESNQRAPAPGARKRCQTAIAEPASDLGRLRECGVACGGIALHNPLDGGRNQQISAHDRSRGAPRRGCARLARTIPTRSDGAALQQPKSQPAGGSSGPFRIASIEECLMRARANVSLSASRPMRYAAVASRSRSSGSSSASRSAASNRRYDSAHALCASALRARPTAWMSAM